jgi:hypothetical protein
VGFKRFDRFERFEGFAGNKRFKRFRRFRRYKRCDGFKESQWHNGFARFGKFGRLLDRMRQFDLWYLERQRRSWFLLARSR